MWSSDSSTLYEHQRECRDITRMLMGVNIFVMRFQQLNRLRQKDLNTGDKGVSGGQSVIRNTEDHSFKSIQHLPIRATRLCYCGFSIGEVRSDREKVSIM